MKPAAVHEHGSEEGWKISGGIGKEAAGDKGPLLNECLTAAQFYEEEQDVQDDQDISDQWHRSASAIIITKWHHGNFLLLYEHGGLIEKLYTMNLIL